MIEMLRLDVAALNGDIEMDEGGTEDLTPENIFGSHRSTKQSKLIKVYIMVIQVI